MNTLQATTCKYLELYRQLQSVQLDLTNRFDANIKDQINKANSRDDLDKVIGYIDTEVPKSIALDSWYQLIHSKYMTL